MLHLIGEIIVSIFFVFGLYCAFREIWRCIISALRRKKRTNEKIDNYTPNTYNKESTSISKQ